MSLAIEWGEVGSDNSGFIYFDAVISYSVEIKGKVTEHPIDSGSSIGDHFTRFNPKLSFGGVISGADISTRSFNISNGKGGAEGRSPLNVKQPPDALSLDSGGVPLGNALPDSITQLFSATRPVPQFSEESGPNFVKDVELALERLSYGQSLEEVTSLTPEKVQLISLYHYEYDSKLIRKIIPGLVMTSLLFEEDPDSGDALHCKVTLQKPPFVSSRLGSLSDDVASDLADKAAKDSNKGKQDSTENGVVEDGRTFLQQIIDSIQSAESIAGGN